MSIQLRDEIFKVNIQPQCSYCSTHPKNWVKASGGLCPGKVCTLRPDWPKDLVGHRCEAMHCLIVKGIMQTIEKRDEIAAKIAAKKIILQGAPCLCAKDWGEFYNQTKDKILKQLGYAYKPHPIDPEDDYEGGERAG